MIFLKQCMRSNQIKFFLFVLVALMMVAGAIFVVAKNSSQAENLWRYAPRETEIFVEFDLADGKLAEYFENNKVAKEELENFLVDNGLPAGIWQAGIEIQRVAMFVTETNSSEKKTESGWIIQSKNNIEQLNAFLSNFYFESLDKRTIIITKSKEVMSSVGDKQTFFGLDASRAKEMKGAVAVIFLIPGCNCKVLLL
jgi:hypothetical protein